jgi:hypothetical protein
MRPLIMTLSSALLPFVALLQAAHQEPQAARDARGDCALVERSEARTRRADATRDRRSG